MGKRGLLGGAAVVLAAAAIYFLNPFAGSGGDAISEEPEDSSTPAEPTPKPSSQWELEVVDAVGQAVESFELFQGDAKAATRTTAEGSKLKLPFAPDEAPTWLAVRAAEAWSMAVRPPSRGADDGGTPVQLSLAAETGAADLKLSCSISGGDDPTEPWVEIAVLGDDALAQAARLALANLTDGSGRRHGSGSELLLPGMVPGAYHLRVGHAGCPPLEMDIRLLPGQSFELPVELEAAAALSGQLQEADGSPIAGAEVGLVEVPESSADAAWLNPLDDFRLYGHFPIGALVAETYRSAADGSFHLDGIPSGNWQLLIRAEGHRPFTMRLPRPLAPGEAMTLEEAITLDPGLRATLSLVDEDGQPVPGATLHWQRRQDGPPATTAHSRALHSNAQGLAELRGLPAGDLVVEVRHPDYAVAALPFHLDPLASGTEATQAKPLRLVLAKARAFAGQCLDATTSAPIAEVYLKILPVRGGAEAVAFGIGAYRNEARSDEHGDFSFPALPPGQYYLLATHPDYAPTTSEPFLVDGTRVTPYLLRLRVGASLEVELRDEQGQKRVGDWVLVQGERDQSFFRAATDAAGLATFTHLPPGTYRAMRADAVPIATSRHGRLHRDYEFIALQDGETRTLQLGGRVVLTRLEGYVVSGGRAQAGRRIALLADDGVRATISDASGFYEIGDLVPGSYLFQVSDPTAGNQGAGAFFGSVEISDRELTKRDIVLPQAAIEVHVVDDASGRPIEHLPVSLRPADGTELAVGAFQSTDAQGLALFPTLRPGAYLICAGEAAQPYFGGDGRRAAALEAVVLPEGRDGTIRAELRLGRGASFRGRVLDRDGRPVAGATLHYLDAQGQLLNRLALQSSDASGRLLLQGLPPGPGRILARHPTLGQAVVEVDLEAGKESRRDLTLEAGESLQVTAVDDQGHPMTGVLVALLDGDGHPLAQATTGAEAQATRLARLRGTPQTLGPLAPGDYVIVLYRPGMPSSRHPLTIHRGDGPLDLRLPYTP